MCGRCGTDTADRAETTTGTAAQLAALRRELAVLRGQQKPGRRR